MVIGSVFVLIILHKRRQNKELAAILAEDNAFGPVAGTAGDDDVVFIEVSDPDVVTDVTTEAESDLVDQPKEETEET